MSPDAGRIKAQQEERERQRKHDLHSNNISSASSAKEGFEQQKAEFLDRLTDTGMSDAATNILDNMFTQNWVLGNISGAEKHEVKMRLQTMFLKIKAMFPPEESDLQGAYRAFLYDDRDENINALTDKQQIIISQAIIALSTVVVSRSEGGFQQDKFVEQISVSEVRNPEEEKDGLLAGLVS